MAPQSGVIPYNYSFKVPFQMDHRDSPIGISGIVFEQAGFVLADLFRRSNLASILYPDFFKYRVLGMAGSGYTPSNTDINLASITDPGIALTIDQIKEYRQTLVFLMERVGADTQDIETIVGSASTLSEAKSSTRALADWLMNSHPGRAPRANQDLLFADEAQFTRIADDTFPTPESIILNMDVSYLGGSGILLDIDFGEVIFQPYPYIAGFDQSTFLNPFDESTGDLFNNSTTQRGIITFPIYPSFQKADGSVVSITTRENGYNYNGGIGSGGILLWGAYIFPSSTFLVGSGAALANTFTPIGMSTLPHSVFPLKLKSNSPILSGIVLDPPVLPTGLYKVGVRNSLQAFPDTAIPSGFISIYPRNGYPSGQAYEVFNDTFWLYALGGLITLSPYTGRPLHFRRAQYVEDTSSSISADVWSSGQVGPVFIDPSLVTISEHEEVNAGNSRTHFQTYNTNLTFQSETITSIGATGTFGLLDFTDAVLGGGTIFASTSAFIRTFDTSFNHLGSYTGTLSNPLSYFNTKLWSRQGGGLAEVTLTAGAPLGSFSVGSTKTVNITGLSEINSVITTFHGLEITDSTSGINGIWLWVTGNNTLTGQTDHWLLKVTEDATEFIATKALLLRKFLDLTLARSSTIAVSPTFFRRIIHLEVT